MKRTDKKQQQLKIMHRKTIKTNTIVTVLHEQYWTLCWSWKHWWMWASFILLLVFFFSPLSSSSSSSSWCGWSSPEYGYLYKLIKCFGCERIKSMYCILFLYKWIFNANDTNESQININKVTGHKQSKTLLLEMNLFFFNLLFLNNFFSSKKRKKKTKTTWQKESIWLQF